MKTNAASTALETIRCLGLALGAVLLVMGRTLAQPGGGAGTGNDLQGVDLDATGPAARLAALRRARDTLIRIGDFNAALTPATETVAAQDSAPDRDYAHDLEVLARVQTELQNFDKAEANYLKAIDSAQASDGEFSLTLIEPYRGLGRMYIKSARYPEAITALKQAQHISQRNLGLFNVEQAPLLDDITTAYLGAGDTVEARKLQIERVDNAVRRFGADDPRVIPFRYQLADYYERSRMPVSAREQYEAVLKSQEAEVGSDAPALMKPLREVVKMDLTLSQGDDEAAHSRLMAILEHHPDSDPVERGLSLAVLGDWATVTDDVAAAQDYYSQAWAALRAGQGFDAKKYFDNPVALDFVAPLSAVDRGTRPRPYGWASVAFKFDLSADGRPHDVKAVGIESPIPSTSIVSRYLRRVRETHFRPRIVDGQAVATQDVKFTHYFRYYVKKSGRKDAQKSDSKDDKS